MRVRLPLLAPKHRLGGTSTRSRIGENRAGESTSTQEGKPELYFNNKSLIKLLNRGEYPGNHLAKGADNPSVNLVNGIEREP